MAAWHVVYYGVCVEFVLRHIELVAYLMATRFLQNIRANTIRIHCKKRVCRSGLIDACLYRAFWEFGFTDVVFFKYTTWTEIDFIAIKIWFI